MTLVELGQEYEKRANILMERIHELNKQARKLTGERQVAMRRRIQLLYQDVTECRIMAYKMRTYYERNDFYK